MEKYLQKTRQYHNNTTVIQADSSDTGSNKATTKQMQHVNTRPALETVNDCQSKKHATQCLYITPTNNDFQNSFTVVFSTTQKIKLLS